MPRMPLFFAKSGEGEAASCSKMLYNVLFVLRGSWPYYEQEATNAAPGIATRMLVHKYNFAWRDSPAI